MRDIVGLYLDPPDRALVLCIDEKSQIIDRTQPMRRPFATATTLRIDLDRSSPPGSLEVEILLGTWIAQKYAHYRHFTPHRALLRPLDRATDQARRRRR